MADRKQHSTSSGRDFAAGLFELGTQINRAVAASLAPPVRIIIWCDHLHCDAYYVTTQRDRPAWTCQRCEDEDRHAEFDRLEAIEQAERQQPRNLSLTRHT